GATPRLFHQASRFADSQPTTTPRVTGRTAPGRLGAAVGNGLVITSVLSLLWLEFPGRHDWSIGLYVGGLYLGRIVAPSVSAVLVDEPSWRAAVDVAAWVEDRIAPYSTRP